LVFVVLALIVILVFASGVFKAQQNVIEVTPSQNSALPFTIDTYGNAWDGPIAFGLSGPNGTNYLVIMDTNGTLLDLRASTSGYGVVKNIAQNNFLFEGEPQLSGGSQIAPNWATHIWNIVSNTTQDFPNVISHHDVDYNPINNTFLTLQDYVRPVGNNFYLIDKILEVDAQGNVLWTWDAFNHLPLSEADPFNNTSVYNGQPVIDFTHTNALLWDYNNNVIYLNVRNTNTFYKINQTTGNIIWGCGQFGNFTLVDANGSVLPNGESLWYHSHDLEQVAPDVFTMFNDDFDNVTNYYDSNSQMIEFTLNEQNMTATIIRSWTAPIQYYSSYLGATDLLPNGDWLGDFGTPTHQFIENQPWNFTNAGAVLIDVNAAGQIVRTITFPTGWAIYRNQVATNISANALSPMPTPTLYPSATPPTEPTSFLPGFPAQSTTQTIVTPTPAPAPAKTSAPTVTQAPTIKPTANASSTSPISVDSLIVIIAVIVIVIVAVALAYLKRKKT
jgi:hypothetical protein